MMLTLLHATLAFLGARTTVRVENGRSFALHGSGPPVLFSTGGFGTMPRIIYAEFCDLLKRNVTVIVPRDMQGIMAIDARRLALSLGVESVGLFTHSSFDRNLLKSRYVSRAMLCDPISFPIFRMSGAASALATTDIPTLVVRAARTHGERDEAAGDGWTVPDAFRLVVEGEHVHDDSVEDVGHVDILDDLYANLANNNRWFRGMRMPTVPYIEWIQTRDAPRRDIASARSAYRRAIAAKAADFFLDDCAGDLCDVDSVPCDDETHILPRKISL